MKKYFYKNKKTGERLFTNHPLSEEKMKKEGWFMVWKVRDGKMNENKIYQK